MRAAAGSVRFAASEPNTAAAVCFIIWMHDVRRATSRVEFTAGKSRAIMTTPMAMTISNSINVNANLRMIPALQFAGYSRRESNES